MRDHRRRPTMMNQENFSDMEHRLDWFNAWMFQDCRLHTGLHNDVVHAGEPARDRARRRPEVEKVPLVSFVMTPCGGAQLVTATTWDADERLHTTNGHLLRRRRGR
ncbi:uncharacterized protein [Triticum aestivum]|uniref:uncharacterized protein n=1 Tax=Triticum aestivum TaxID=4565 RepID=UPI001D02D101|nr:uncharacterized protein LOC123107474 [Triticum aestivum]